MLIRGLLYTKEQPIGQIETKAETFTLD